MNVLQRNEQCVTRHVLIWTYDLDKISAYKHLISSSLDEMNTMLENLKSANGVNADPVENKISDKINNSALSVFVKTSRIHHNKRVIRSPWFNNQCIVAKSELNKMRKILKKEIKTKIDKLFQHPAEEMLYNARYNSKKFWSCIKSNEKNKNPTTLNLEDF